MAFKMPTWAGTIRVRRVIAILRIGHLGPIGGEQAPEERGFNAKAQGRRRGAGRWVLLRGKVARS
jgi:hypothetical protein